MIEYKDDKLGQIKVLNVTEARANFATVLGDKHSHYIITKNNKPMRVIINYKDYETLKRSLSDGAVPLAEKKITEQEHSDSEILEDKKKKKSKSRVKGMLESSMSLSKQISEQTKPEQKTEPAQDLAAEPIPKSAPLLPKSPPKQTKAAEEAAPLEESQEIAEPEISEEIIESEETPLSAEAILAGDESADYFQSDQEDEAEDLLVQPDESISAVSEEDIPEEELAAPDAQEDEVKKNTAERNPEEEEYFKKYKKLYESMGVTSEALDETEAEPEDIDTQLNERFNNAGAEAKQTATPKIEEPIVAEDGLVEPLSTEEAEKPVVQEEKRTKAAASKDELPSLKDLLMDLEQEKLSGEGEGDENLDDKEIDELIERITSD